MKSGRDQLVYSDVETSLGRVILARHHDALAGLWFAGQKYERQPYLLDKRWQWVNSVDDTMLAGMADQVGEYFDGTRARFDIGLAPHGTSFQQAVWSALQGIDCGETVSYGELAARMGRPEAVRAVSAAIGRNPVSIVIPCHRVVGANGQLTGYAGGVERKQALLELESSMAQIVGGKSGLAA